MDYAIMQIDRVDVQSESAYNKSRIGCHVANECVSHWHSERMARMRQWTVLIASSLIVFSGCSSSKKPNDTNLRTAIDQYLPTQNRACVTVDGQFPIDVPSANSNGQSGPADKLAALEHAGLVQSTNTIAVVQNLANALSLSPHKPEPVKRYTVSNEGQKYVQNILEGAGRFDGFCYGHEKVASIVNWTEPQTQGSYTETTVTYTGKVPDLAAWAKLPEVERAFPTIKTTLGDMEKNQTVALHLTSKGWGVNNF
jgi:hypothetical protein